MDGIMENQTCPTVGYQAASICVPVTVTPYANAGATVVIPGRQICAGVKNGVCSFTLSQNVCVAVPVEFGANASVGEAYVECLGASAEDTAPIATLRLLPTRLRQASEVDREIYERKSG